MKKLIFAASIVLITSSSIQAQLKVNASGLVGIGTTTPETNLTVIGSSNINSTAVTGSTPAALSIICPSVVDQIGAHLQQPGGNLNGLPSGTTGLFVNYKPTNGAYVTGIRSTVFDGISGTTGNAVAILGIAGSGTNGGNVGVAGLITTTQKYGTAIYGGFGFGFSADASNNWAGYFAGNAKITGTLTVNTTVYNSDRRLKKEIINIQKDTYAKISQLTAFQYKYKTNKELSSQGLLKTTAPADKSHPTEILENDNIDRNRYGFIAQDVQKIFPELVYEDGNGLLAIDYVGLIPLMIEGLKQQDAKIEDLKQQLGDCCNQSSKSFDSRLTELEQQLKNCCQASANQTGSGPVNGQSTVAALYQNSPNPFSTEAQINCYIPKQSQKAELFFYNLQGKQILKKQIDEKENARVAIHGSELGGAGTFLYTLIIDGKEIDTKKMILTE